MLEPVVFAPAQLRRLRSASAPVLLTALVWTCVTSCTAQAQAQAQNGATTVRKRPNIVLMFPDNLGIGEVSSYGGARGVPTPSIDRIAQEGIRLTNFNVEYSCVVSRIALLTGRYAVRTGEGYRGGMTLWEVTIAEALRTRASIRRGPSFPTSGRDEETALLDA
jgi:Sulfatase